jgi:hypothetical protein
VAGEVLDKVGIEQESAMSSATINAGVKVAVKWSALVWEACECEPCQYGVYAMGPACDMDGPHGTLLEVCTSVADASDLAHDHAERGMWPDDGYWVEVRNVPSRRADWQTGWRKVETSVPVWEAGPF